jgi:single-stranded-DNA-specific exonuclease
MMVTMRASRRSEPTVVAGEQVAVMTPLAAGAGGDARPGGVVVPMLRSSPHGGGQQLAAALHPVLSRVYAARGLRTVGELALTLDRMLPVSSLPGIDAAAELLLRHRAGPLTVIGDFDADGATSTALMVRVLRAFGFTGVDFLVPNRFEFGYGLTPEIVHIAAQRQPRLLVTVDMVFQQCRRGVGARTRWIDVLVTTTRWGAELPDANVIVNRICLQRLRCRALGRRGVRSCDGRLRRH